MQESIARLLRFQSSRLKPGEVCSFDEYIARMPAHQKHVHYLMMPDRKMAEASPYYEPFKANNIEVPHMNWFLNIKLFVTFACRFLFTTIIIFFFFFSSSRLRDKI